MAVRSQPIDSEAAALAEAYDRIRRIDETLRDRLPPPGYVFNVVAGNLVITRKADGATTTLVFA